MNNHLRTRVLGAFALAFIASTPAFAGAGHGSGSTGEPGTAAQVTKTINIIMRDNFYEPESISVKEGQTVRFVITNKGEFVHEFNIGTAEMHAEHQKEMMMMVEHGVIDGDKINHELMKMDMGNGKTMQHDDPNSVLLEPGTTAEIIWTFPEHADLEFACNVPGHYASGMAGPVNLGH